MFSDVLNSDFNKILPNKCKPLLVGLRIVITVSGNILHIPSQSLAETRKYLQLMAFGGFPGGTRGKELACQCRRHKRYGFNPWAGKIPWRRAWQPTSVILVWRIPGTEEPGGLQSIGLQRVEHDWSDFSHTHTHTHTHALFSLPPHHPTLCSIKEASIPTRARWFSRTLESHLLELLAFKIKSLIPHPKTLSPNLLTCCVACGTILDLVTEVPAISIINVWWLRLLVTLTFLCCRKRDPFQGLRVGSCLTLRMNCPQRLGLTKQEILLGREAQAESSKVNDHRRLALSHVLQFRQRD